MATGQNFFRTFKGLSELKLYNVFEDVIYNLPVPLDVSIMNGTQERRIPTRNIYGEQVFAEAFTQARDPVLRIVFPTQPLEILEFQTERKFATKAGFTYTIPKTFEVDQLPVTTGNIALDLKLGTITASSIEVSVTAEHLSQSLTVTNAVAPTAAITSGNATLTTSTGILYLLGTDFIGGSKLYSGTISVLITVTADVLALSDNFGDKNFKMFASMVTNENELVILTAPKAQPSFQNTQVAPSAEQSEIVFYLYTPAGECKPYDIISTGIIVEC